MTISSTRLNQPKTIMKNNRAWCRQSFKRYSTLAHPRASTKAIGKELNTTTEKRKTQSLSENAALLIIHLKKFILHIRPQVNKARTRCTSTGYPKARLENNWLLTLHFIKPNSFQKTPRFSKTQPRCFWLSEQK